MLLAAALVAVCGQIAIARAQTAGGDSSAAYWGAEVARPDSATGVFRDPPIPIWMGVVYWPVRIVAEPVILLADGISAGVGYLGKQKVIQNATKLLGPQRGPLQIAPTIQAGGLSGFGGGFVAQYHGLLGEGSLVRGRLTGAVNGDSRATLGSRFSTGSASRVELGIGYRMRGNARYFGIGPTTSESDESFYRQKLFWVGGSFRQGLGAEFYAKADLCYTSVEATAPQGNAGPSITEVFAGDLPYGYGTRSYGYSLGLQVGHDNVPETGRPIQGGSQRVRVERFESTDHQSVAFWNYRAELQQFFTLWHSYRILALRGFGSWIDPTGASEVPFQRLMVNQMPDALRGYESFRYRDQGMVEVSAEYRFPLWASQRADGPGLDLYPLVDVGQVFDTVEKIQWKDLTASYGLGIRIVGSRGFIARLEYAQSDEEIVFRFSAEQLFQFDKSVLLYGRDPIPSR